MISYAVVVLFCAARVFAADEGVTDSKPGVGTNVTNCRTALDGWVETYIHPQLQICSNMNSTQICCQDITLTTTAAPCVTDMMSESTTCPAIPLTHTSLKTGQKAWDKCVDYQEQLVYPCEKMAFGGAGRVNHCHHDPGGVSPGAAAPHEFPHTAALGYGEQPDFTWWCVGVLISERFILTAAYCVLSTPSDHPLTFAYIGAVRKSRLMDPKKLYRIKNTIQHPEYKYPSKYNDIALLETEIPVKLDQFVVPACLHVGEPADVTRASATAWGDAKDILQKYILTKFTQDECTRHYSGYSNLEAGVVDATQMCFGNTTRNTCDFPCGGPLLIRSTTMHCMHVVAGVSSYGARCFSNAPGVFTRVAPYVPWIESFVWP